MCNKKAGNAGFLYNSSIHFARIRGGLSGTAMIGHTTPISINY